MDFGPDSYRVRMFDVGYCEFRISDIRCRILLIWEEEADESIYWLELLEETGLISGYDVDALKREANELTAIFTAIGKTAKRTNKK